MISAWKPSTNLRSEGERATSGANEATEPVRCLVLTRDQPERGRLWIAFRRRRQGRVPTSELTRAEAREFE